MNPLLLVVAFALGFVFTGIAVQGFVLRKAERRAAQSDSPMELAAIAREAGLAARGCTFLRPSHRDRSFALERFAWRRAKELARDARHSP